MLTNVYNIVALNVHLFFFFVLLFVCMFPYFFLSFQQLRVVRAFKSTLEDMEERRSVHSLHSLHSLRSSRSHPKQLSDISYIDEDVKTPSPNDYPYDIADSQKNAVFTNNSVRNSNHNNSQYIMPPPQNHSTDGDVHETAPLMIRTMQSNNRNINPTQGTPSNSPTTTTSITPVNSSSPSSSTSNNRTNVTSPVARGYHLLETTKIHETSI